MRDLKLNRYSSSDVSFALAIFKHFSVNNKNQNSALIYSGFDLFGLKAQGALQVQKLLFELLMNDSGTLAMTHAFLMQFLKLQVQERKNLT
ncbi:hypothetical protein L596_030016 [Steinernema carpocapsae]|uniref:Uncharacterized protein n=1 Tax=Steinernema carpocapsae TaxID=34508 RepID=A0A4U5LRH9_STECR|nr:hypothetical protein L596_030016 [Steinernema carpocapsae]